MARHISNTLLYTLLFAVFAPGTTVAQDARLPVDTAITTQHEVVIRGERVPYRATVGTLPVFGPEGEPIASLLYTFYERTDVTDRDNRPLAISFNGGPGSASVWMHIGYTSPVQLIIDDEGYPVQPYGVRDNPNSILDVTDIVFVNPVNVGFSRIVGDAAREQFFGVNEDIAYLADWIGVFVTRHDRWTSPKFLIGESYGTTRVSGLAGVLQGRQWMYLNGVILVSPTGLGVRRHLCRAVTSMGSCPRSSRGRSTRSCRRWRRGDRCRSPSAGQSRLRQPGMPASPPSGSWTTTCGRR